MKANLKVKDLLKLSRDSKVLIYVIKEGLEIPVGEDIVDLYDGIFDDLPVNLFNRKIYVFFPYLKGNEPYLYIQVEEKI